MLDVGVLPVQKKPYNDFDKMLLSFSSGYLLTVFLTVSQNLPLSGYLLKSFWSTGIVKVMVMKVMWRSWVLDHAFLVVAATA